MRTSPRVALVATVLALATVVVLAGPALARSRHHDGGHGSVTVTKEPFGSANGQAVDRYTLSNGSVTAKIITYGGIIQELWAPDRKGKMANITLGFGTVDGYLSPAYIKSNPYFGAIIGRYGNRIAKGRFTPDGKEDSLDINNDPNSLHGGFEGFNVKVWKAQSFRTSKVAGVSLTYFSPAGEGCTKSRPSTPPCTTGYPGDLDVKV